MVIFLINLFLINNYLMHPVYVAFLSQYMGSTTVWDSNVVRGMLYVLDAWDTYLFLIWLIIMSFWTPYLRPIKKKKVSISFFMWESKIGRERSKTQGLRNLA